MQIDFIGCTSAGKSTLIRKVVQAGRAQGIDALTREEFVLQQLSLNWVRWHGPRMFLVDLVAFWVCLTTWRTNLALYRFVARSLFARPIPFFEKFYLLRNVLRKIGLHEMIRQHSNPQSNPQQVILVDEGTLQTAHNLFVHHTLRPPAHTQGAELARLIALLPIPDVVVYVRQPTDLLIERTLQRGHRRLADASYCTVASFIEQAVAVFDELTQNPTVASRLLISDGNETIQAATTQDSSCMRRALHIVQNSVNAEADRSRPTHGPIKMRSSQGW